MTTVVVVLLGIQLAFCVMVLVHAVIQLSLTRSYLQRQRRPVGEHAQPPELPRVTVQLPIYNERYVVERLIDTVAALDYPRERLEIQVLDDSTDDTVELAAERVRVHREAGLDIVHIRREQRTGYKAGALAYGLERGKGELFAVFDADFLPAPDFLRRTVPHFANPAIGMVQTRWGHANAERSLLTRMQEFLLDAHFAIEQEGRAEQGCFINFNGSAGVWRAEALRDAGGWDAATLTEDLDVSYRAQLRGWKFVYLGHVRTAAELPEDIRSYRTQQFRWMKGVAQNAVRLIPQLISADLPARVKLHACAHLLESSLFLATLAVPLLTVPLFWGFHAGAIGGWVFYQPLFLVAACLLVFVYFAPHRHRFTGPVKLLKFLPTWAVCFTVTMGFAVHHSVAVVAGWRSRGGEFVRTPKATNERANAYVTRHLDRVFVAEAATWLILLAGLVTAALHGQLPLLWLPALSFVGLTYVLVLSLRA